MPARYDHLLLITVEKLIKKISGPLKNPAIEPKKRGFLGSGNIIETRTLKIIRIEYGFNKI
jgi:hypothetical protein